ncbi:MAG: hypothetical protein HQ483_17215 [Rhodospirillales bacterium]|nr:hypothetical protein [Rhodospirillales bacterium]
MGILNGPRINFWGGIQTNVCTANNSDSIAGANILDLATASLSTDFSDDEIIRRMRAPGSAGYTNSGWNYYGDHLVKYVDAKISSQGKAGAISETGDLVGLPIQILGSIDPVTGKGPSFGPVMVDLDPTSSQTTQIFVGGLQIGSSEAPELLIHHDTVCSSHSLALRLENGEPDAPGSSQANGTFQLTFPFSGIVPLKKPKTISPILAEIMGAENAAGKKATGFVLRFSMFEMAPYLTTPELLAEYAANNNLSNPSSGHVIGTLGPYFDDEPETCPPGRLLINQAPGGAMGYAITHSVEAPTGETTEFLSIDSVSLMMKKDFRQDRKGFTDPIGPNIDYGLISIAAGAAKTGTGLSFYARPNDYYIYGGIIDIPLTSQQATTVQQGELTLTGGQDSVTITEQPLRIYSNSRNLYIQDFVNDAVEIDCIVSYLGGPAPGNTDLQIKSSASGTLQNPACLSFPNSVAVPGGSHSVVVPVQYNGNNNPGTEQLSISGGGSSYFINFRNYHETDFGIAPGAPVTWDQAYSNVLRFYYVVFPAMSTIIPLNNEAKIKAMGPQILARLSGEYRNTTLCMPITRSMSPSHIKLLTAFLSSTPWLS